MHEQHNEGQSNDFITWDDLANERLSKLVNNELNRLQIREQVNLLRMRWVLIIIAAFLISLLIVYSIILYFLTGNPVAPVATTGLIVTISVTIIRNASRFAFKNPLHEPHE